MGIKIIGDSMMGLDTLLKEVDQNITMEVGITADADPITVMKAIVNEFGYDTPGIPVTPAMRKWFAAQGYPLKRSTKYIKIPARPFISKGIYDNLDEIWNKMDELIVAVHNEKLTTKQALHFLGALVVTKIQEYMEHNDSKPNHPLTVKNKGHSNPLVDTRELKSSIAYGLRGGKK